MFVVAAHLVYQIAVPGLVREKSRDDLIRERREAFQEDRPDRDDLLRRAFDALAGIAKRMPFDRHRNFTRRHGDVVWLPSDLKFLFFTPLAAQGDASPSPAPVPDGERMRVVIDEGARAEYDLSPREDRDRLDRVRPLRGRRFADRGDPSDPKLRHPRRRDRVLDKIHHPYDRGRARPRCAGLGLRQVATIRSGMTALWEEASG